MRRQLEIPSKLGMFHDKLLDGLEFCRLAYTYFDEIASGPNGGRVLHERKGAIKQLLEELLPICRYVQAFYGPGHYISVRWMQGNQAFDAKMESTGALVDHGMWPSSGTLEVTQAVHPNEHLMRELLNAKGGGFGLDGLSAGQGKRGEREIQSVPTSYSNQSYIDDMCSLILKAIEAKIKKLKNGDYPEETVLIVDCVLMTIFLPGEWDQLVAMVKVNISARGFRQIFLTAETCRYSAVI